MMSRSVVSIAIGVFLACVPPASAQPPARPIKLTAPVRAAALARIKDELQASYVFLDARPKLVAQLDRAQKAGRYDVDDAFAFAERVTDDLREVTHDHHL